MSIRRGGVQDGVKCLGSGVREGDNDGVQPKGKLYLVVTFSSFGYGYRHYLGLHVEFLKIHMHRVRKLLGDTDDED